MSWITYEIDVDVVKDGVSVGTLETELVVNTDVAGEEEWNGLEIADAMFEEYDFIDKYPTQTDLEFALNELMEDKDMDDVVQNGLTLTI